MVGKGSQYLKSPYTHAPTCTHITHISGGNSLSDFFIRQDTSAPYVSHYHVVALFSPFEREKNGEKVRDGSPRNCPFSQRTHNLNSIKIKIK